MSRNRRLILDVSNQNPIDAVTARAASPAALIAKETEGTSFMDGTAAQHRAIARQLGIPFGGYLFLHVASPRAEAEKFLAFAQLRRGDLQPIIDAEVRDGATMAQVAHAVDECAHYLEGQGFQPILYASASFWIGLHAERPDLRRLRVWEADYPGRFTRWLPRLAALRIRLRHGASVVIWQWTDRYQVGARRFDASRLLARLDSLRI